MRRFLPILFASSCIASSCIVLSPSLASAQEASGRRPDRPPVDTRLTDHGAPLRQVPQGGQTFAGPFSAAPPPGSQTGQPYASSAAIAGPPASGRSAYVSGPLLRGSYGASPFVGVSSPGFGLTCSAQVSSCVFGTGQPLGVGCVCPTADGAGDFGFVTF